MTVIHALTLQYDLVKVCTRVINSHFKINEDLTFGWYWVND